jgi:RNA-directed DNA polymerase
VGLARKRCWDSDWVIDLDIRAFFDSIPHDLVERICSTRLEHGYAT